MIGDIVHIKGIVKGSGEGQCRPAIIVRQWIPGDNVEDRHVGTTQLVAFVDGSNDGSDALTQWHTSVQHRSKSPEGSTKHYHYPSECDESPAPPLTTPQR